jgi:hypothetical protein
MMKMEKARRIIEVVVKGSPASSWMRHEGGDWRWRRGSLFTMVKAVMSGRSDELIDPVRTNLWR